MAKTLKALPPGRFVAWIGPGIGPEAYEIGPEVIRAVSELGPAGLSALSPGETAGKGYLDLFRLAENQLRDLGVLEVYCDRKCTFASADLFSYRRDGITGRMATLAWRPATATGR